MAATAAEVLAVASALKDLATAAKSLKYLGEQVQANNSAQEIDWNSLPAGAVTDGTITGFSFTGAEASDVLGSLAAFDTFWGTHGGNFEKLTTPIV